MTHDHASFLDVLGAVLLVLWAVAMWAAVGVLAYANRRSVHPMLFQASACLILVGIVGQLAHVQEHFAQAAYWIGHNNDEAWMTPWGDSLARGLGQVDSSTPELGMEILHLVGNFVFLAGLVGVLLITRRALHTKARKWGRMGVWMQGIHGVEHLVLTVSIALGASQAIGLSTWFGVMEPGPGLWTYRVWWHFVANVMGSVIFMLALRHLWLERREIEATYRANAGSPGAAPVARATRPRLAPADAPVAEEPAASPAREHATTPSRGAPDTPPR
ncbi:DUF6008 family protein [Streptomyces sedi]|uniref:DUF6008 family protein n=1 Tax=Streptomyces sedi TaxID=555059 RepID=UPI001B8797FD|nr:DUF6008 family protein [Streptomyces sedi]